jgi:hypothetical protein
VHLNVAKWGIESGVSATPTKRGFETAAYNGHFGIVQWLDETYPACVTRKGLEYTRNSEWRRDVCEFQ